MRPDEALGRLMAQTSKQMAALKHAVEQVGELTVSARSADGLVLVEVGAQGQLHRVRLDPGVSGRVPPAELAGVITGLVRQAAADADERDWRQWLPGGAGSAGGSGGSGW